VSFQGGADFREAKFADAASFRGVTVSVGIDFSKASFSSSVTFDGLKGTRPAADARPISFLGYGTRFSGRCFFNWMDIDLISFHLNDKNRGKVGFQEAAYYNPGLFEKDASFRGIHCKSADFTEADFGEYADFSEARFDQSLDLGLANFRGAVSFSGAGFPALSTPRPAGWSRGISLNETRFQKGVVVDWDQIAGRLAHQDPNTWASLEHAFRDSGNLGAQNQAMYQRRLAEWRTSSHKAVDFIDWVYWGYGVGPWRLLGWFVLFLVLFSVLYHRFPGHLTPDDEEVPEATKRLISSIDRLTERLDAAVSGTARSLASEVAPKSAGETPRRPSPRSFPAAIKFGLDTSWKPLYGFRHSQTSLFNMLTAIHWAVSTAILVCLIRVISNVSPLADEILGKLIPK
jgi:uncharacterized protein YjbI with pentapeptide repeats